MQSLHTHPTDTARSRPEDQPFHVRILQSTRRPSPTLRLALGFLTLGATNNALYVVILTAALELIPKGVPTGVVAFANIAPALVAKAVWPYVLKGKVRYAQRVWSCVALSLLGIMVRPLSLRRRCIVQFLLTQSLTPSDQVIAFLPALWTRLMGIALASFSSGLGELTFLQLSTRYGRAGSGKGVGWFSSGTGAAGLVGALAWWIVRPLGVKGGLCTLSFLPLLMGLAYGLILPSVEALEADLGIGKGGYAQVRAEEFDVRDGEEDEEEEEEEARLPGHGHGIDEDEAILAVSPHASLFEGVDGDTSTKEIKLSLQDKIQLIKPMLLVYILPLVLVYFFE
jgi:battenin